MASKLGDTITTDFIITNPITGACVDADSTPICEVFQDTTDEPMMAPLAVKRDARTGNYRVSIIASSQNGFAVGPSYNVVITATVGGITARSVIATIVLDGKRVSDLHDIGPNDLTEIIDGLNSKLQYLDTTISSRATAADISNAIGDLNSRLQFLDSSVSSRATPGDLSNMIGDLNSRIQFLDASISSRATPEDISAVIGGILSEFSQLENLISQAINIAQSGSKLLRVTTNASNTKVCVYSQNLANLITQGETDVDGDFTFALWDGTYQIIATKAGAAFIQNPILAVIPDQTQIDFTSISSAIDPPVPAETCRVYAFCFKSDGVTPMDGVTALAQVTHLPHVVENSMISGDMVSAQYDPLTGKAWWDLVRGATVLFSIREVGLKVKKLVPDQETVSLISM